MTKEEKAAILAFASAAFKEFYAQNPVFLTTNDYKPGKKTYRNLSSLNKMMKCYIDFGHDYVNKNDVIKKMRWPGPSTYVQHERIITNFGLSDTSWQDRDREVLLLSDSGKQLRDKYVKYIESTHEDLGSITHLPDFAIEYLTTQIINTTAQTMTLWKNTIITALFVYSFLGYIPKYSKSTDSVTLLEKLAFKTCLNYVGNDGTLLDITYTDQPIAMLKNLHLLDDNAKLTDKGYEVLKNMKLFSETDTSYTDYSEYFKEDFSAASDIMLNKTVLKKVEPPERKKKAIITKDKTKGHKAINRNFEREAESSRKIGKLGEQLALNYERERLKTLGVAGVETKVFLTSDDPKYGNAYPCDIISTDESTGNIVFIEVKSTKSGINTPFYISKEEVDFSYEHKADYKLYRLFNVVEKTKTPEVYETSGYVGDNFSLICDRYIATRDVIDESEEDAE